VIWFLKALSCEIVNRQRALSADVEGEDKHSFRCTNPISYELYDYLCCGDLDYQCPSACQVDYNINASHPQPVYPNNAIPKSLYQSPLDL